MAKAKAAPIAKAKAAPMAKAKAAPMAKAKAAPMAKAKAAPIAKAKAAPSKSMASKKAAPKAASARGKTASAPKTTPAVRRRDALGHLDPRYAAHLRSESGKLSAASDNDAAFVRGSKSNDELAEELGEEAVQSMTSGEYEGEEALNQVVEEETGGPFVQSTAGQEFAEGTDPSNPKGATREPFPKA
jgi:hypothetical protein